MLTEFGLTYAEEPPLLLPGATETESEVPKVAILPLATKVCHIYVSFMSPQSIRFKYVIFLS